MTQTLKIIAICDFNHIHKYENIKKYLINKYFENDEKMTDYDIVIKMCIIFDYDIETLYFLIDENDNVLYDCFYNYDYENYCMQYYNNFIETKTLFECFILIDYYNKKTDYKNIICDNYEIFK